MNTLDLRLSHNTSTEAEVLYETVCFIKQLIIELT